MCKNIQNDILMQKKMHEIFIQELKLFAILLSKDNLPEISSMIKRRKEMYVICEKEFKTKKLYYNLTCSFDRLL